MLKNQLLSMGVLCGALLLAEGCSSALSLGHLNSHQEGATNKQTPIGNSTAGTSQATNLLPAVPVGNTGQSSQQPSSASTVQPAATKIDATTLPVHTAVGPNFDWNAPSDGPYPTIQKGDPIWIDASLNDQRVRIMKDSTVIYTMITSSGLDGADTETPKGTFYIEPERDTWFYTPQYQEGAKYWVSWKNHGEFLFHSVAMDKDQHVKPEEAAKLGVKASHGCFRLTVSDAKWIFDNIPTGTKVVIHD